MQKVFAQVFARMRDIAANVLYCVYGRSVVAFLCREYYGAGHREEKRKREDPLPAASPHGTLKFLNVLTVSHVIH